MTLLAVALLQSGCEQKTTGSATQQASDEYSLMQEEMMATLQEGDMTQEEAEEIDELLQHFSRTADAGYATEKSGLTMLHLACLYKHAELARCLLLDGASPHACLKSTGFCGIAEPSATPLLLAVTQGDKDFPEQEVLSLIQHLLKAGAVVNMQREGQGCTHESIYLALLEKAEALEDAPAEEVGIPLSIGKSAAENGWYNALRELLRRRNGQLTAGDKLLLHYVTANNTGSEHYRKCAELLLQSGISANTQDSNGATPLFTLTTGPCFQQDEGAESFPMVELLLRNGGDINLKAEQDQEFPCFTPLDFMMTKPRLMEALKKNGFSLPIPPIRWDDTAELPREICRAHLKEHAPLHHGEQHTVSADTAQHFDTIARLLNPDTALRQHPLYTEALAAGIELMACTNADKTAELLANMPLWTDPIVWKEQHPHALAILEVLTETPSLVLPGKIICQAAETMERQGQHDMAAAMLELLGRCPDAAAYIAHYEQDSRLCMQAGALQATLLRAGLPAARCYAVRDWLTAHGKQAEDSPVLQTAVLLTSQEDIWFDNMPKENRNAVFDAMEKAGAPLAAQAYRNIAAALHDAERLDAITADSYIWKFELECATARYILRHANHFLPHSSGKAANTD